MFDIRKGNIDNLIFHVDVSKSIEMTLEISFYFFLTHNGTGIELSQDRPFSFV